MESLEFQYNKILNWVNLVQLRVLFVVTQLFNNRTNEQNNYLNREKIINSDRIGALSN